ncbi:MAG: spore coat associated protein CotJA [Lachnospiraceae bacterium]|nr:spore coat associated protein CotJA [Lachnospiraceae bacterium]
MNTCEQCGRNQYAPCSGRLPTSNRSIAMAYVPWQHFQNVYDPDKALRCGTIFPELNKPFLGKRGACL